MLTPITMRDPRKLYLERFVFMAALLIPAVFRGGIRPLVVCALCVVFCMLCDWVCCKFRKIKYDYKDPAVLFWGLSAGMLMPASVPLPLTALAAVLCIAVGKHIFGGNDNLVFSPPALAAAFMVICYPGDMLYYPKAGEVIPVFAEYEGTLTRSVEYTIKLGSIPSQQPLDILMGNVPGAIGTVNILIILVVGICMLIKHSTSFTAVISCVASVCAISAVYPRADVSPLMSVFYELSSGYLLFGIIFMSAEPYLLPKRRAARVIYGVVLGYTVMMLRYFGQVEGCFVFALLITNALSGCFDTIVENVLYWKRNYISSFEGSKRKAQQGGIKLTDTQEIQLPEKYRYNTPPIDGKIKRQKRKKQEVPQDKEDGNEQ
ncbi:MAG: RnfABCDGE type electron transport complex subunit D [Oscillospiraceae bacterium]